MVIIEKGNYKFKMYNSFLRNLFLIACFIFYENDHHELQGWNILSKNNVRVFSNKNERHFLSVVLKAGRAFDSFLCCTLQFGKKQ